MLVRLFLIFFCRFISICVCVVIQDMLIAFENVNHYTPYILYKRCIKLIFARFLPIQIPIPTSCVCCCCCKCTTFYVWLYIHIFFSRVSSFVGVFVYILSLKHCEYIEQRCSEGLIPIKQIYYSNIGYPCVFACMCEREKQRIYLLFSIRSKNECLCQRIFSFMGYSYLSSYSNCERTQSSIEIYTFYRYTFMNAIRYYNQRIDTETNGFLYYSNIYTMKHRFDVKCLY